MKHKTSELEGALLDMAVCLCLGWKFERLEDAGESARYMISNDDGIGIRATMLRGMWWGVSRFSSDWATGGPIIHRENIAISPPTSMVHRNGGRSAGWGPSGYWSATTWHAGFNGRRAFSCHETEPLVAAMRCYVASKLGEEVDLC